MVVLMAFLPAAFASQSFYLVQTSFNQLPRWDADQQSQALLAFDQSCQEIMKRNPAHHFGHLRESGEAFKWQRACVAAGTLGKTSDTKARAFFEHWFVPYAVKRSGARGLFTGYYLPLLRGSLVRTAHYNIPVYGLPYHVEKRSWLSRFFHFGRNNQHIYPDRIAIENGAMAHRAPVLFWVDNPIDLFFAQIQGSAKVVFANGESVLLGYAGDNGHTYFPIGRVLVEKYGIDKNTISMQSIRNWLYGHPNQAESVLNSNPSYVFFRILRQSDPVGTEDVMLTPRRSLAIDTAYLPLGAPIWVNTAIPYDIATHTYQRYRHLLIAQDTGGAIKGPIRADIYWGSGREANFLAGNMKSPGEYWVLLPR